MGDDISLGLLSMAVCFDFRSTNVVQLINRNPYFYGFRCHHPLITKLLYMRLQKGFGFILNLQRLTQIEFQGDLESRELDFLRKFACHWIWWLGGKLFDLCFFFMRTIYMSKPVKKCLLIITKSSETTIFPFLQTAWIHRFFFNWVCNSIMILCGTLW